MTFKSLSLSLLFLGLSMNTMAQEWKKKMANGAPYSDVVETFEKEWGDKPYQKHQGFKPYYRYKTFWESRLNSKGEIPTKRGIYQAHQAYMATFPPMITGDEDHGFWRTEGPFDHTNTTSWSPGQGRVNVVVEDPNDENTIYIGAPDGGLWKSEDAGSNWTPLIETFSRLGISDLVVDFNNSQTIYIATGDADGGDAPAIGVWKSIDGGTTWNEAGSISSTRIYKIEMDPDNSNRLLAATNNGLFRTENGGTTWTEVTSGIVRDIQFALGTGNQNVFAVTESGFIKSSNNGATWTSVTNGIPNDFSYMRLDVTADDSNYVYVVGAGDGSNTLYRGIYKSTDAGTTFTEVHSATDGDIFDGSGQAWYDLDIAVDQNDKNTLVVGVLNIWRSTNGGTSWNAINSWSSPGQPSYTHADIHFLKWHGNNLYCGSDGGVYKSTNDGDSFEDLTRGLPIGQYYDIEVYQKDPSYISGGLQDNGGYYFDGIWKNYYGADGMTSVMNQEDSTVIYGMIQNGVLQNSSNGGNSVDDLGTPGVDGQWVTPMEWDAENNRIIAGYDKLFTNDGTFFGWSEISTFTFPALIGEIELYNDKTNTMLVSTNEDGVFRTIDGGATWTNVITNLPTSSALIKDIEFDESDSNHFFIVQSFNIYETTDAGATWSNINGNLPFTVFNDIEMDHSQTNKSLYVATDVAVHYFNNTLGNWIPFNENLPNVVVSDIEILSDFNAIRVGTYGRGIYASHLFDQDIHQHDAQIWSKDIGVDTLCSTDSQPIRFEIKNRAWDTINNVSYEILINNVSSGTNTWSGQILPFQRDFINSTPQNFSVGVNNVEIIISQPNGMDDSAPENDTLRTSIFVEGGTGTNTVLLELNLDNFASETGWSLKADDGTLIDSVAIGGYAGMNNQTINKRFCLADDCYDFVIHDQAADFSGSYTMVAVSSGELFAHQSNFGAANSHDFCLPVPTTSPTANFNANDSTVCFGESIEFTDVSLNEPTSWNWTFENGTPNTSTDQNPTVTYNSSGEFDVQLIVSNAFGSDTLNTIELITVFNEINYTLNSNPDPITNCMDSVIMFLTGYDEDANLMIEWKDNVGTVVGTNDTLITFDFGDFSVEISDTNGCMVSENFQVSTGTLSVELTPTNSQCLGLNNGSITGAITGDAGPFTIEWSDTNLDETINLSNLEAGEYIVFVTDTNGCVATDTAIVENILNFNYSAELGHVTCNGGNDGFINSTISGGNPPYSYEWSFDPLNDTDTITGVSAGDHSVTITDVNGCQHFEEFTIEEGYTITINSFVNDETCQNDSDGDIFVNAVGGTPPYTYSWSDGLPSSPNQIGLTGGSYSVVVTDSNGCTANETIEVKTQFVFTTNYTVVEEVCDEDYNGSIQANITGGVAPYTLEWLNLPGETGTFVDSLTTGPYYLSITGANGCNIVDTIHVGIESPIVPFFTPSQPYLYLDADPTFTFNNLSTGGLSYSWNFGDGNFSTDHSPSHTYSAVGDYYVKLIVFNGICSREYIFKVSVYPHVGLSEQEIKDLDIIPNPNNGIFSIDIKQEIYNGEIRISDVIGRQISSQVTVVGENKIELPNLLHGTYLIHILEDGKVITTKKMIVE
ncbi:MAG: VPS10 domain-containing protein [Flavobacteriales bacterium]